MSTRAAGWRLATACAALLMTIMAVPLLVGPISEAMVPECPEADATPAPVAPRNSSPVDSGPPAAYDLFGGGRASVKAPPPAAPSRPAYDLFGGAGEAPATDASDGSSARSGGSAERTDCPHALPDDLPTASDLSIATALSLLVGLIAAVVATVVGAFLGLLSGYRGGLSERLIVRGFANGLDALPQFVLLVTAAALYRDAVGTEDDSRLVVMGVLIGLVNSTQVLLIVHHQTRLLTARKFVVAARLMGWGPLRVVWHKVLPHLRHELIIPFTQLIVWGLFMETALSYLGFSPTTRWPTLGAELYRLQPFLEPADVGPTIVMCLTTVLIALALRAMGDAIEALADATERARFASGGRP